jgi:uncharacterized membrane protein
MTEPTDYDLLIGTFDNESAAVTAAEQLMAQFAGQPGAMPAVASVVKTAAGELAINEKSDIGAKQGAAAGALAGGLVGLISRRGAIRTAALGALIGGVAAHKVDTGIPDPRLEAIGASLDNATSAVVAILSDEGLAAAKGLVAGHGGTTVIEAIDHQTDFMKQIRAGNYSGALTALANQTESRVAAAPGTTQDLIAQVQDALRGGTKA